MSSRVKSSTASGSPAHQRLQARRCREANSPVNSGKTVNRCIRFAKPLQILPHRVHVRTYLAAMSTRALRLTALQRYNGLSMPNFSSRYCSVL